MYKNVFVDQIGYLPGMKKHVTIRSDAPVAFEVRKSDGSAIFHGVADKRVENPSAKETDYIGDFTAVREPGRYYILTENHSESDTFVIDRQVYTELFQKAMKFFYLQRCGCELPKQFAGKYAHCACHTGIASVYGSSEKREVSGGWHDAGDYGRYVGPGAMAVAQLLYTQARNQLLCSLYNCPNPPTAEGNIPAYLEELKYELDWMMKMQREDGALYHKATCRSFCGFIMPQDETDELVLSPVSVTATADFAAVCAMAVSFYQPYDGKYAAALEKAARRAYQAMKDMQLPGGFHNPDGIVTGEYGDPDDTDERYWAAAELYKAFGDAEYRTDFETLAADRIRHGYGWVEMGSYGNLAYIYSERPVDEALKNAIKADMVRLADTLLETVCADGYGTALPSDGYAWGSNLNVANNGLHLYDAWMITTDRKYLDAAAEQLHYLLGRNPMGLCYVTGCGTDAVKHPHHRPSGFVGQAMPGMLSGGPCDWMADEAAKGVLTPETAPAKCLVDMTDSYSTNEVTIYWNSALLMLLTSVLY